MDYLATGFRNVDHADDQRKFQACLEFINNLGSFQKYKQVLIQRLNVQPGHSVADIGCGLGYDVIEFGRIVGKTGSAIGIDASEKLITAAQASIPDGMPQVGFRVCEAENLALRDHSVDAIKIDRTLQHIKEPRKVLQEMHRVLKPGGMAACAEPDWGTFTINSPDRETTRRVANAWCDSFQNGWIGRELQPLMRAAGFKNIEVTGHLLSVQGFLEIDRLFDITHTAQATSNAKWLETLRTQEDLIGTVTLFVATGQKPSTN